MFGQRPHNISLGQDTDDMVRQSLADGLAALFTNVWLPALLHLNPVAGVEALEKGLKESAASKTGAGVQLFAELFDRDYGGIGVDLRAPGFAPQLLLQLLRLAYQHVPIGDDAHHEGSYSPDTRDNAEKSRNAVLSALLSTAGPEGLAVKLEMADDPLFVHIKDRTIALAQERAAEEADNVALTEAEFAILDKSGESPPTTREAMFSLMRDRLDDIDDLLLQDISPRELPHVHFAPNSGHPLAGWHVRLGPILLQKSQIAERQFFRQKTRQEVIAD
jgi:hypothetical protein